MKKINLFIVLALLLSLVVPLTGGLAAKGGQAGAPDKIYIVQMIQAPVVAYDGSVPGLNATKPAPGKKINPQSSDVMKYAAYLEGKHNDALAGVGGGQKVYSYKYSFNGFAAKITGDQAALMKQNPDVVAVTENELLQQDTSSTPAFLGLDAPGGIWEQLGGSRWAGEGVVIGIVDGGIWPEHPSFSDRTCANGNRTKDGKLCFQQIPGWHGKCTPGEAFNASNCNQKLIGAQFYNAGWGGNAGIDSLLPWEYNSARDYGGHGTHTASTAGGNYGVPATGAASVFGSVSGMAPRARIAAYKVCWQTPSGGSCYTIDSIAAIDQAVADGVDVINYSISGTTTNFLDPVEVAFLYAADAGVFVAASAGNSGPTVSTVAHPSPWITTVAAGTHNRNGNGSVTLGNGVTYTGASVATAVGPAPLVDSVAAGMAGANPVEVELCYPGTLDPAVVTGKIVICKRGVIARVDKSRAVMMAGGVGMVMYNSPDSSLNADFHWVPTVHVNLANGTAIKAYAAGGSATATINQATIIYNAPAPFTASFSSRGPLRAGNGDLLKPDVIAPGQDILAAVAPPGNYARSFDLYSGTSMSSPHVAGIGALFKHLYPGWSPMAIKSALMTSAGDVLDGPNTNPLVIFRQGAGHIRPNVGTNPGLVFNHGFYDWLAFLCGTTNGVSASTCAALPGMGYSTVPTDLNGASLASGALPGSVTFKRRVTNVSGASSTYGYTFSGLTGMTLTVSPANFTLAPGASQNLDITVTNVSAPLNAYVGGQLTFSDGAHSVRVPVAVRPVSLGAPTALYGNGSPINYDIKFGYTGAFSATARGLVAAAITPGTVPQDPDQTFNPADPAGTIAISVVVPAGTTYARFELFDADVDPGSDIDLYVYNGATIAGSSRGGTSAEQVSLTNPAAGTYTVYVHGWGVANGVSTPFKLYTWLLDSTDAGNMTVTAPAAATIGTTSTVSLAFSGLAAGTQYLGSVAYSGVSGLPNPTIVRVDTP